MEEVASSWRKSPVARLCTRFPLTGSAPMNIRIPTFCTGDLQCVCQLFERLLSVKKSVRVEEPRIVHRTIPTGTCPTRLWRRKNLRSAFRGSIWACGGKSREGVFRAACPHPNERYSLPDDHVFCHQHCSY